MQFRSLCLLAIISVVAAATFVPSTDRDGHARFQTVRPEFLE